MILVTGATGFVGIHLCLDLVARGFRVRATGRSACPAVFVQHAAIEYVCFDAVRSDCIGRLLSGVECVLHCAARTHVMKTAGLETQSIYNPVNVDFTVALASQAAACGVKRFVFLSTIKVNGESSEPGQPFRAVDTPHPSDPYAVSKLAAEQGLFKLAHETSLEVVMIRAPIVYGPGVKGNFRSLIKLVKMGWPLPLGQVRNLRSLIGLSNLTDLMICCMTAPAAKNSVIMASDGRDISTSELLLLLAAACQVKLRLFHVPACILFACARLLGKATVADRLLGSLQIDLEETQQRLGWHPPYSVETQILQCIQSDWADIKE
ncbi:NAD-dependent epimerase/dehydratase family protein [Neptuniibacter sp. CAU 1671]|uniref:NAD-dependent epimerase/dehydratase family protein n=1 Tax=Neptuniibacter sp. CAU 1671 TaxID=3032593 RepID=UPI0023D9E1E7|nr:NAD-dependent epimerase/dehydratase family protein [Neptuniibacter sp. CAU 1671]MDF2181404.1 NAD-dependent epimerase/dehydratase family protein [Neptuniibacter sp. CAU 1671]